MTYEQVCNQLLQIKHKLIREANAHGLSEEKCEEALSIAIKTMSRLRSKGADEDDLR